MGDRFSLRRLSFFDAAAYQGLTFARFAPLLLFPGSGEKSPVVAVGAERSGEPVGLALGAASPNGHGVALSVYTVPEHRRHGVAARLLEDLEKAMRLEGSTALDVFYATGRPYTIAVEALLRKGGFPDGTMTQMTCRCRGDRLQHAPWIKNPRFPRAFEVFPWSELSAEERQEIEDRRETSLKYPDPLSPFWDEDFIEPLNSLGLRSKGEVVGWQINHRFTPSTIRYSAMFVREDLQASGLALVLQAESIRRHLAAGSDRPPNAEFIVSTKTPRMVDFVQTRMAPFIDEINRKMQATKSFA